MKPLLPQPFKFVGYALPILFILVLLIVKLTAPDLMAEWGVHFKGRPEVFFSVLNVGFLLVILSRDKFEDERTVMLRIESITFAFLFGTIQVLFHSLGIWTGKEVANSASLMGMMLGIYLLTFEYKKRFGA